MYRAAPLDSPSNVAGDYAIKVLKPEFAARATVREMFLREAFLGQRVNHPHLRCVLSAQVDRSPFFLVMPFQPGISIRQLLKMSGRLSPSRALWITRQIAEGLASLHSAGWLHGDVKPDNASMTLNGHTTLSDYGLACPLDKSPAARPTLCGTSAYLAPEQLCEGHALGPASDVYSLGVMLYELLTGTRPFAEDDPAELAAAHRTEMPPDVRPQCPGVSPPVGRLVRRMLAKEPLRRPTGGELISLLIDAEIDAFATR